MSVSKTQLRNFAKLVTGHDALEEVKERINKKLYQRWLVSDDTKRKVIGDIHAAQTLFFKELNVILAEIADIEE